MDTRRRLLLHLWLQSVLWIVIAVLITHIGSAWFGRFDLTRDQKYSLSPTSREAVDDLDRPLLAKVYFSKGLEAPYHNHEQALNDKLEELRAWSGGRLEIVRIDPTDDRDLTSEAQRFGIRPVTYTYRAFGREEARTVFMGVSFVYGDRQQAVDALPAIDQMEYELVRAILAVTTEPGDRKVVGYVQGHGEPDLAQFPKNNPLGGLRDELTRRFDLRPIALGGDGAIPEDVDALLMVGPQETVDAWSQLQLDQFVMRGGSVGWFISGIQPDFRTMLAKEVPHGLHPLLGHYGVKLDRNVVVDRKQNEVMVLPVNIGARQRMARVNYPLAVVSTNLDRTHHAVRSLKRVVAPFATTLSPAPEVSDELDVHVWAQSGPDSSAARNLRQIRARSLTKPLPGEEPGPFPLAVSLAGPFTSFFADKSLPTGPDDETWPADEVLRESEPTRMVVVSSGDFVANNPDFVLNTVDWMLEDPILLGVRTRNTGFDVLELPDRGELTRLKATITGAPLIVLFVLGGLYNVVRRRRR